MDIKEKIRTIPNYPEEGVIFRDITTLLKDAEGMVEAVNQMQARLEGLKFDLILGPESRGFIFGMPIAYNLRKGFVPIRKAGKLPGEVVSRKYTLEYGTATIEMHKDAVQAGQKVIVIDDLLATGGTARAIVDLVESIGAEVVSLNFLIELEDLGGRKMLEDHQVETIIQY